MSLAGGQDEQPWLVNSSTTTGPPGGGDAAQSMRQSAAVSEAGQVGFMPLGSRRGRDVCSAEAVGELPLGEIPSPERARCLHHRLVPAQLAPDPPRPLTAQLDADVEPCGQDDLGGKRPPGLAVELDLDSLPRPREERANSWRKPLRRQPRPPPCPAHRWRRS